MLQSSSKPLPSRFTVNPSSMGQLRFFGLCSRCLVAFGADAPLRRTQNIELLSWKGDTCAQSVNSSTPAEVTVFLTPMFVPSAYLSGQLSEYGLIVPFSTDSRGRYVSHVVSSAPGHRRVARSAPGRPPGTLSFTPAAQQLFFNVTVFGKELHLRLRANGRLVAPGAFVEWQEDYEEKAKERVHGDCVFTGDVTHMPDASVALSNCDGLVS
ncbi:hypothetical protein Z043_120099 [Scleropages formosus]|uniref:Peptidase M12B propeptide domain-containing protein n=1 Tax=Scleropages formosus TaxID=113540 RepID=A0A0P7WES2_SCLFO|nr:hypothetical protein Z043_120099 [Scleropages formosus]